MRRLLSICLVLFGVARLASAHPLLQNAMWVEFEPQQVRVAVNVSLREIAVVQGIAVGTTNVTAAAALDRAATRQADYVLSHLVLTSGTKALAGTLVQVMPPPQLGGPEQTFYQYELVYPWSGPPPAQITFENNMLKEWPYALGTAWDLSYVIRAKRSDANTATSWLLSGREPAVIPTGWEPEIKTATASLAPLPSPAAVSGWRMFWEYFRHGVMHILTGYDHLLFVSALVLATKSFWEMVKVIAAFTLAHTLTLALCVFGIFRLPPWVVEPVIALSIVLVALENYLRPQRAQSRLRLAVAFGFGLIHGLGFAGGLLDAMAGLPPVGTWIALGAFSLGVETGHQLVVLPLFGLLAWGRFKMPAGFSPALQRYGSAVVSGCGAYYLVVAVQEQFFGR